MRRISFSKVVNLLKTSTFKYTERFFKYDVSNSGRYDKLSGIKLKYLYKREVKTKKNESVTREIVTNSLPLEGIRNISKN